MPGIELYLQPIQDLTIDTQVSRTQYQFTLQATSLEALSTWVPQLVDTSLKTLPQVSDVSSDWQDKRAGGVREGQPRHRQPLWALPCPTWITPCITPLASA